MSDFSSSSSLSSSSRPGCLSQLWLGPLFFGDGAEGDVQAAEGEQSSGERHVPAADRGIALLPDPRPPNLSPMTLPMQLLISSSSRSPPCRWSSSSRRTGPTAYRSSSELPSPASRSCRANWSRRATLWGAWSRKWRFVLVYVTTNKRVLEFYNN